MRLPDFLIVGAARAGTTSLHYLLQQHPEICMSRSKEPNYFLFAGGRPDLPCPTRVDVQERLVERSTVELDAYLDQFSAASEGQKIGEASPSYLSSPGAAARIRALVPGVRIIVILRHPVERSFSHYKAHARHSREGGPAAPFVVELERQQEALDRGEPLDVSLPYVYGSLYGAQLRPYLDAFPREQIEVVLFEDFRDQPAAVMERLFAFLDVAEDAPVNGSVAYNASAGIRIPLVETLFVVSKPFKRMLRSVLPGRAINRLVAAQARLQSMLAGRSDPDLAPPERTAIMQRYFAADVAELEAAIGRDLSTWRR